MVHETSSSLVAQGALSNAGRGAASRHLVHACLYYLQLLVSVKKQKLALFARLRVSPGAEPPPPCTAALGKGTQPNPPG